MDPADDERLSRMETDWPKILAAHGGALDAASEARGALLRRYERAVKRYLCGALRDEDGANELYQEFALRVLRGQFKSADPQRGRFRDFLKTSLYHLIVDYQKRRKGKAVPLGDLIESVETPAGAAQLERVFQESWREELLAQTWRALKQLQQDTGQPHYTVLRLRSEHPELGPVAFVEQLSARLGKPYSHAAARQALHRAREKFADLLLKEVSPSLESGSVEELEQELADVGLLAYCRSALKRLR